LAQRIGVTVKGNKAREALEAVVVDDIVLIVVGLLP
jgi:hypothetical protein